MAIKGMITLHDLLNKPLDVRVEMLDSISENTNIFGKTAKSVIRVDGENHAVRESRAEIDALIEEATK